MRSTPDVRASEIAEKLLISRSAAYTLMHELGAVHVGRGAIRGARGSLRLDRRRWLQYLDQLACSSKNVTASTAPSASTLTQTQANAGACCAPQASESTAPKKAGARRSIAGASLKQSSTARAVLLELASVWERAQRHSSSPPPKL